MRNSNICETLTASIQSGPESITRSEALGMLSATPGAIVWMRNSNRKDT